MQSFLAGGTDPIDAETLAAAVGESLLDDGWADDPYDTFLVLVTNLVRESTQRSTSALGELIAGKYATNYECPACGQFDNVENPFFILDLKMPESGDPLGLTDCFAASSVPEKMKESEKMICSRCKRGVSPYRIRSVAKVAPLLIVRIERWTGVSAFPTYLHNRLDYPDEIDVGSFAAKSSGRYRLVTIVFWNSQEKPTCVCLDAAANRWIYYDGEKAVVAESARRRDLGEVYILIYQRIPAEAPAAN
jgi:ubiquitin C-terminal hydrolase